MASHAQALSILYVISSFWCSDNWYNVVRVGLAEPRANTPAILALPPVPRQHSKTPPLVPFVAIATLVSVWPVLDTCPALETGGAVFRHARWHQSACHISSV